MQTCGGVFPTPAAMPSRRQSWKASCQLMPPTKLSCTRSAMLRSKFKERWLLNKMTASGKNSSISCSSLSKESKRPRLTLPWLSSMVSSATSSTISSSTRMSLEEFLSAPCNYRNWTSSLQLCKRLATTCQSRRGKTPRTSSSCCLL